MTYGYPGCYGNGYGYGAGGAVPLLLDTVTGAAAAWSLRKLRTAYSGPAIRVRRSSDNTEQDIGFVAGVLDTASLLSFCGAGDGFVATWYDQSGNARDLVQATAGNQPKIVSSGTTITDASVPAIQFTAASSQRLAVATSTAIFKFLHDGTSSVVSAVSRVNDTAIAKAIVSSRNTGPDIGFLVQRTSTGELIQVYVPNGATTSVNNTHTDANPAAVSILSIFVDADNGTAASRELAYEDGVAMSGSNSQTAAPSTSNSSGNLTVGANANGSSPFDGTIQEVVLWDSDVWSQRSTWEADQAAYYGIALP